MKRLAVVGHFGGNRGTLSGQTVKTKELARALEEELGTDAVMTVDTYGGIRAVPKLVCSLAKALRRCHNIIILPAQNGVKVIPVMLQLMNPFFGRRLHYVVIGGWLPQLLLERRWLSRLLQRFHGIYVETKTMKRTMEKRGFHNVYIMPNCKKLTVLGEKDLVYPTGKPFKLCTFSRVMKEKGIETAVEVIKKVNEKLGYTAYSLDIYGQVDTEQTEWFDMLKSRFPDYVRYCGCAESNKSVEVLQDYFALLFPTHFYTEGIPGTIIDAYAAGIPVISARWESYADVVDEGKTGIGYDFDNESQFAEILLNAVGDPKQLLDMKINCLNKAKDYIPQTAIQTMIQRFGGV